MEALQGKEGGGRGGEDPSSLVPFKYLLVFLCSPITFKPVPSFFMPKIGFVSLCPSSN